MLVKLFTIRLDNFNLEIDQNSLNDFLETIHFIKSDTHFIESDKSYWSVLIHYLELETASTKNLIQAEDLSSTQQIIYNDLKKWRSEKATQNGLKNFMICHNSELISIAVSKPSSVSQLKLIKGFGTIKSQKFGDEIISLLNAV